MNCRHRYRILRYNTDWADSHQRYRHKTRLCILERIDSDKIQMCLHTFHHEHKLVADQEQGYTRRRQFRNKNRSSLRKILKVNFLPNAKNKKYKILKHTFFACAQRFTGIPVTIAQIRLSEIIYATWINPAFPSVKAFILKMTVFTLRKFIRSLFESNIKTSFQWKHFK